MNNFQDYACLLISVFIFFACVNNNKHNSAIKQNNSFTDSVKVIKLISATIELPILQRYFISQTQLVILDNQNFKGIEKLYKFGKPITLMNTTQINDSQVIFYLRYEPIRIKNDSAFVNYYYCGKDINIVSTLVFKNNEWNTVKYVLTQY